MFVQLLAVAFVAALPSGFPNTANAVVNHIPHVVTALGPSTVTEALPNATPISEATHGVIAVEAQACPNNRMARSCIHGGHEEPVCCSASDVAEGLCACLVLLVCCPLFVFS